MMMVMNVFKYLLGGQDVIIKSCIDFVYMVENRATNEAINSQMRKNFVTLTNVL